MECGDGSRKFKRLEERRQRGEKEQWWEGEWNAARARYADKI